MYTRKIANNLRLLSIVSILLSALYPLFSVYPSSAGLPTSVWYGNIFEYALISSKCTYILLRCIRNRLYILVILELVCTLMLGTVYPPLYVLYLESIRIC